MDVLAALGRHRKRLVVGAILAACVALLLSDIPIHQNPKFHPHFDYEKWFGWYAGLSLISCLMLAITARIWRSLVQRSEDYYRE